MKGPHSSHNEPGAAITIMYAINMVLSMNVLIVMITACLASILKVASVSYLYTAVPMAFLLYPPIQDL